MTRIYLAGSSSELAVIRHWRDMLAEVPGIEPVCPWVEAVEAEGEGNPRGASDIMRAKWSRDDMTALDTCDLVWWLMEPGGKSEGAALEVGYKLGRTAGSWRPGTSDRLVVSGDTRRSIFPALGREYDTHGGAFLFIADWFGVGRP
jgi:hypothetical protein